MFDTLKSIFSVKDLRNKLLFTLLIILIFRIGTFIPIPGFDKVSFEQQFQSSSNTLSSMVNVISGGAFKRFSIFAMSIGPYITATIILQLLAFVVPALEKLQKEGERGKQIIAKYSKYLTIVFSVIEAVGLYFTYKKFLLPTLQTGAGAFMGITLFVISLTAGTSILMWLGDRITEKGIGNGISMIIFIGIVSGIPSASQTLYKFAVNGGISTSLIVVALVAAMILVIAGVIYIQQAERRISVQYSKRVVGRKMYGGQSTHIPLKVAMAGVMPIIFAMSFLMFPNIIAQMVTKGNPTGFWSVIAQISVPNGNLTYSIINGSIYMFMIIIFTFFYTMLMVNPIEIANQLKKNAGFVPGIRAGKPTSDYIMGVLNNITWFGGFFLALVAVFPIIIQVFMKNVSISLGGTSILIVVSVALELLKQIESQMVSKHYKGFLN